MASRPRLLFLSHLLPWPPHGGGQIKTGQTLNRLSKTHEITFLSFIREKAEREYAARLSSLCKGGMRLIPLVRGRIADVRSLASALVSGDSWLIRRDDSPVMRQAVCELLRENRYETVWADHLQMAQFVPHDTYGTRFVLDMHNAESDLYAQFAHLPTLSPAVRVCWEWESVRLRHFETAACLRADTIHAVSPEDAVRLDVLHPGIGWKITVTPILPPTDLFSLVTRSPQSRNLLFVGTLDWPPNTDALLWFVREIWPDVRRVVPEATFTIVGARANRAVIRLARVPGVRVAGFVDDVTLYVREAAAFVAPLRAGGGVRVKILTAQAWGLPVITTPIGAEGLPLSGIIEAGSAEQFAHSCVSRLT